MREDIRNLRTEVEQKVREELEGFKDEALERRAGMRADIQERPLGSVVMVGAICLGVGGVFGWIAKSFAG